LDKLKKEFRFLDEIKRAQIEKLVKVGWTLQVANEIWSMFRESYLRSWREYVDEGLVSLPAGLVVIPGSIINKYLERR